MAAPLPGKPQEHPLEPLRSTPLWYLLSTAAAAALPVLVLPFVTSVLAPAEYGAWVLAYAFGVVVSAFVNTGLPAIYERSYFEAREHGQAGELLWTTLLFVAVTLALALLGTWLWREWLAAAFMQDHPHPALIFWTTCAVGASSLKAYFLVYLRNTGDARQHALYSLQEAVLGALATVLLVAWWRVGPLGLAWGPLVASAVVLAQLALHFGRRVPPRLAWRPLRHSLALALPLTPRVALGVVGQVLDKWVVGAVAATGGVAAYAIGQRLAYFVFVASTALENVFQPRTYRLMFADPRAGGAIGHMLTPFVYATVGVALVIGLGAAEAVAVLARGPYAEAVPVATVLAVHFALLFFGKQPQLLYAKKTAIASLLGSVSILVSAAAMYLLAVRYGAVGAAAGTALSGAVMTFVAVRVSQRYYRIGYERTAIAFMYGFLIVALALVHLVPGDLPYAALIAVKGGLVAAYAGLGLKAGYWRVLAGYAAGRDMATAADTRS